MVIFAAEFRSTINVAAPISQVARGGDSVDFSSDQDTKLGYSYWCVRRTASSACYNPLLKTTVANVIVVTNPSRLVLLALLLHLVNVGLALWYIFGVIRRKQKIIKVNYESGPDNVILF